MIKNLHEFFLPEHQFYLESITYNKIEQSEDANDCALFGVDHMDVSVKEEDVVLTVRRTLKFRPESIFELSIAFGAILHFNPDRKDEYDWSKINLAEEFRKNGQFVTSNLMGRISMLISEITSSFGRSPIITPPAIAEDK